MYFQQGRLTLGRICIGPQKGHPGTPGMNLICTVPRPHLLARPLIWPGHLGASIISFEFVRGLVSLAAKASLVPISDAIIFLRSLYVYLPLVF